MVERGALGVILVRVTLVAFGGGKRVNRAVMAAATALRGWGGSNPLIFSTSWQTCICSILFFDSLLEYPFAIIAAGIFTLMSGLMWLSHTKKNLEAFTAWQSTWYCFLFDDILSFQVQEKRCTIWLMVHKENQTHCGATMPLITTLWNRSSWIWSSELWWVPLKSLMWQLVREIKSQKYENQKSLLYFSDTASRLGGTQCPKYWHCCDPHGEEGWIEC